MKIKNILKAAACCTLAVLMTFCAVGCGDKSATDGAINGKTVLLASGSEPKSASGREIDEKFISAQANFAVDFFKEASKGDLADGENSLVSPLSAMLALAMTANGAKGATLKEMEKTLGGIPTEKLNQYLLGYAEDLPSDENAKLSISNSIWFREGLKVRKSFLQTAEEYYGAPAYSAPFDEQTAADINEWVSDKTDGLIDNIVDGFTNDDVMLLINALLFDAEWEIPLSEGYDGVFHAADGTERSVKTMQSHEKIFISNDRATGFIKAYKGGRYSFAAVLPNEGMDLNEFVSSLTGDELLSLLSSRISNFENGWPVVSVEMPKFECECTTSLNAALGALGMPSAFDSGKANFSNMYIKDGASNLSISKALQKTYIMVDEFGTKAGAVTGLGVLQSAPLKEVILDRPFLYMIIDNETNLPIFIGAANDIGEAL